MLSAMGMTTQAFKMALKTAIRALIVIAEGHLGRGLSWCNSRVMTMAARATTAPRMDKTSQNQKRCIQPLRRDGLWLFPSCKCVYVKVDVAPPLWLLPSTPAVSVMVGRVDQDTKHRDGEEMHRQPREQSH